MRTYLFNMLLSAILLLLFADVTAMTYRFALVWALIVLVIIFLTGWHKPQHYVYWVWAWDGDGYLKVGYVRSNTPISAQGTSVKLTPFNEREQELYIRGLI